MNIYVLPSSFVNQSEELQMYGRVLPIDFDNLLLQAMPLVSNGLPIGDWTLPMSSPIKRSYLPLSDFNISIITGISVSPT